MPRDSNGNYSLPAGNPVAPGELVEADWANDTMNDVAAALNDSLSRSGDGGMLVSLTFSDGDESAPGIAWENEPSSGFYREGLGDMRVSILGGKRWRWLIDGTFEWNDVAAEWRRVIATNSITIGDDDSITVTGPITFTDVVNLPAETTIDGDNLITIIQNGGVARPFVKTFNAVSRDLLVTDENSLLLSLEGSAVAFNVPDFATVPVPVGFLTHIHQVGAGQVTIVPAMGVTINTALTLLTRAQYSSISLINIAEDSWLVIGDMEAPS